MTEDLWAFVDVDGLLIDVNALVVSVTRSIFNTKVPEADVLPATDCSSALETVTCLLEQRCAAQASDDHRVVRKDSVFCDSQKNERIEHFCSTLSTYNNLCRPYFGSVHFVQELKRLFSSRLVFVTSKLELVLCSLQRLLGVDRDQITVIAGRSCEARSFYMIFEKPLCLDDLFNHSSACSTKAPSYYFYSRSSKLLKCCISWLASNYQRLELNSSPSIFVALKQVSNTPEQPANNIQSFYHFLLRSSFDVNATLLPHLELPSHVQGIPLLDLSHALSQAENGSSVQFSDVYKYVALVQPLHQHGPPFSPERPLWDTVVHIEPPVLFDGVVVKGFGRGSALLGIPTANLDVNSPISEASSLPFPGIYLGFAALFDGANNPNASTCYDMILSAGYNPYYENPVLVVEPHLFHDFPNDFFGARLRLIVIGVLRPEANFVKFDHLLQAIQHDCEVARIYLKQFHDAKKTEEYRRYISLLV